jgi:V/A-type H+-transporting ATPase subunit I
MNIFHSQQMVKVGCILHEEFVEKTIFNLGELEIVHLAPSKFITPIKYEISEEVKNKIKEVSILVNRTESLFLKLGLKSQKIENFKIKWIETQDLQLESSKALETIEKKIAEIDMAFQSLEADHNISVPRFRLKKKGLKMQMHNLAKESRQLLQKLHMRLSAKQRIYEIIDNLPHTKRVYFFEGWVQLSRLAEFKDCVHSISKGYGGLISKIEAEPNLEKAVKSLGKPPSVLKYPRITGVFKSFHAITRAFGVPDYYEIDPTFFFLISFPIIFGMMYGDVGHGVVLLFTSLVLYFLKGKFSLERTSILNYLFEGLPLIILCSLSSILFGFLYGEFFGSEEWFNDLTGLHPLWFSPIQHPNTLLRYSLYVGIIHFSFGLILDILNKMIDKEFLQAFFGPLLWLWFYLSGAYLVATRGWNVIDVMNEPVTLALFVILPFSIMMMGNIYLERFMGVSKALESFLISFSHTVSYARILALKLIGTSFSLLILPTDILGYIPFIIGTLFLITIFETLLVFLHTLRLHWIEWFSKFYNGTGNQFKPLTLLD